MLDFHHGLLVLKSWAAWASGAAIFIYGTVLAIYKMELSAGQTLLAGSIYLAIIFFLGLFSQLSVWRKEKEKNEKLTATYVDLDWADHTRSLWCGPSKINGPTQGKVKLGWTGIMKVTNTGNLAANNLTARVYLDGKDLPCYWITIENETGERKADVAAASRSTDLIDDGDAYLAIMNFQQGMGWLALGPSSNDLSCLRQAAERPGDSPNLYRPGSNTPEERSAPGQRITVQFKAGQFKKSFNIVLTKKKEDYAKLEPGDQPSNPTTSS